MPSITLVAVDVRSAHNVGSFFRTADGFGAELALIGITPKPQHDDDSRLPHIARRAEKEIAKTALGAEKTVKWRYFETLLEAKNAFHAEGKLLIGIEQTDTSSTIRELTIKKDVALVVGREVEGLSLVEQQLCDQLFEIPMVGTKESFNVSVAAGIALYQATK